MQAESVRGLGLVGKPSVSTGSLLMVCHRGSQPACSKNDLIGAHRRTCEVSKQPQARGASHPHDVLQTVCHSRIARPSACPVVYTSDLLLCPNPLLVKTSWNNMDNSLHVHKQQLPRNVPS